MAVEHTLEQNYTTKLNFRLGCLKFGNGSFSFVNASTADLQSVATSCNTDYRMNKRYLTAIRERQIPTIDDETVYSTVREALSSVMSSRVAKLDGRDNIRNRTKGRNELEAIFSSVKSSYHAANPNPQQSNARRFFKPNLAEYQALNKDALPSVVPPTYPNKRYGLRVVFPTDPTTRRDIQMEVDANKEALYAQLLANREGKKQQKEEQLKEEQDIISQIKTSLELASTLKEQLKI